MNTMQHTGMTLLAMWRKGYSWEMIQKEIPWAVLPDGIRKIVSPRAASHFERAEGQPETAWMIFPGPSRLKTLQDADQLDWYVPASYPTGKSVIGETTAVEVFSTLNRRHPHYPALKAHLMQDKVNDEAVRGMIDHSRRFSNEFPLRAEPSKIIDGKELRAQIALFEKLGFIFLAGKIYENTGLIMDRSFLNEFVSPAIYDAYPRDVAENTLKYMYVLLDNETQARFERRAFDLTPEECESVYISPNLLDTLDEMYSRANLLTASCF